MPSSKFINMHSILQKITFFLCLLSFSTQAQMPILTGADQIESYLPLLQNKRIALVVNQTSQINGVLLPDTLLNRGVNIAKVFSPEHGFRGTADAGATVKSGIDTKTNLALISLYGNNKKPSAAQLKDVDLVIYDLQDVGVRFYTYISTLEYLMEACAENNKPLLILDRPNPLGFIVDGPVLEPKQKSFVGMQRIPIIYGMTPAEYAKMLIGEDWLSTKKQLDLNIISCKNYSHNSRYELPVAPSPNLKNMTAIYLYPSLCLFEGTVISVGRGTPFPFQQYGHPKLKNQPLGFTPRSVSGASNPLLLGQFCFGKKVATNPKEALEKTNSSFNLKWILDAYLNFPDKDKFFNSFFEKLAGSTSLKQQIIEGKSEKEIRASWQKDLNHFKEIRKKYLIYE